jgi:hypothetical protein
MAATKTSTRKLKVGPGHPSDVWTFECLIDVFHLSLLHESDVKENWFCHQLGCGSTTSTKVLFGSIEFL